MKKIFIGLMALLVSVTLFAERVSVEDAALVANNFMRAASNSNIKKAVPAKRMVLKANASVAEPQYYVYENADGEGWVIIAANDVVTPVLAFSETGHFRTDNMPENIKHWMGHYDKFIKRIENDGVKASEKTQAEWNRLRKAPPSTAKGNVVVAPLIKTTWDQDAPFNNLCPGSGSNKAYTGCVATAMAQVMNFWQWPVKGTSSHTYQPVQIEYDSQGYPTGETYILYPGNLTANFGSTTYDWANMKKSYSGSSSSTQETAVATLMFHCGVGTEMMYGGDGEGGSGTYTTNYGDWTSNDNAQNALYKFFGYKKSTGYVRDGYKYGGVTYYDKWTDAAWTAMVKGELDKQHPIMYGGASDEGGHSFICDGYDDYNDATNGNYFHFNWGWSGQNDGWYRLSSLKPGSGGAGGGGYDFSEDQDVIIGIVPDKPATAIETVATPDVKTGKVIENGQLYIIRNNEKYSVFGQKIQ